MRLMRTTTSSPSGAKTTYPARCPDCQDPRVTKIGAYYEVSLDATAAVNVLAGTVADRPLPPLPPIARTVRTLSGSCSCARG